MNAVPGHKYDDGKLHGLALIPGEARIALAHVLAYGEKKYGAPSGWRTVENAVQRYTDAMDRHRLAMDMGEAVDAESGLPHLWHLLCNAAFLTALTVKAGE